MKYIASFQSAALNTQAGQIQEALLIVCPGSHDQSGSRLAATLTAASNANISLQLILADTLDRHNRGTLEEAKMRGDDWLKRHSLLLGPLTHSMLRWDDIRQDETFGPRFARIAAMYEEDAVARAAIDDICLRHVSAARTRHERQGRGVNMDELKKRSVNYMLEEIAGLAVIQEKTGLPEIYSGEVFSDPAVFNRTGTFDMTLPRALEVKFQRNNAAIKFPIK